jgi:molybdate transport system substrate-binding protein
VRPALATVALAALAIAGCGTGDRDTVTVGAAASLVEPVGAFVDEYRRRHPDARVRVEFAGSDTLAARVRQGVALDVIVAAQAEIGEALHSEGLVEPPVLVARNDLVVAAAAEGPVDAVADLDDPGVRLAIGNPNVPVGAYARDALSLVGDAFAIRAMDNVKTNEPDVRGVVAKLRQGVVDAAIVYRTDTAPLGPRVRVIPFDARDQPDIGYTAATVRGALPRREARRLVRELSGAPGRRALAASGFRAP